MGEQKKASDSLAPNGAPQVIIIPSSDSVRDRKLHVAAYARANSNSEDQLNSFATQSAHYTGLTTDNSERGLVDVYADKDITGTSAEKRDDLQHLLADCRRRRMGKVLMKPFSRFVWNIKECLEAARESKILRVRICFEEQSVDISGLVGEFLTAIFAMMDQKESESISDNMRWSHQVCTRNGHFFTCKAPFGYSLVNGKLEINTGEALIIHLIFDWYPRDHSIGDIAKEVTAYGFPVRDEKPY